MRRRGGGRPVPARACRATSFPLGKNELTSARPGNSAEARSAGAPARLAGLGSIPGAFFAGLFLGLLETMSALFISPSYSDLIVFVTFIVILVVRQMLIARRK